MRNLQPPSAVKVKVKQGESWISAPRSQAGGLEVWNSRALGTEKTFLLLFGLLEEVS